MKAESCLNAIHTIHTPLFVILRKCFGVCVCICDPLTLRLPRPCDLTCGGEKQIICTMTSTPPLDTGVRHVPHRNMVTLKPSLSRRGTNVRSSLHISARTSVLPSAFIPTTLRSWITLCHSPYIYQSSCHMWFVIVMFLSLSQTFDFSILPHISHSTMNNQYMND